MYCVFFFSGIHSNSIQIVSIQKLWNNRDTEYYIDEYHPRRGIPECIYSSESICASQTNKEITRQLSVHKVV